MGLRWTQEEKDLLVKYYPYMSNKELKNKFLPSRTERQIGEHATKRLNLSKDKKYLKYSSWSKEQMDYLKENYATTDTKDLSEYIGKSEDTIRAMAIKLGIKKESHWEEDEISLLIEKYPSMKNKDIQRLYFPNRTVSSINFKARHLGLNKNDEYLTGLRDEVGKENLKSIGDQSGANSPRYNSFEVPCYQCGNPVLVSPSKFNNQERVHCSRVCAGESMSEHLTGNEEFGRKISESWTEEMRLKQAELAVKRLINANGKSQTEPQLITNRLLNELEIIYKNEFDCKYYAIDNYLIDFNLMIEVHGNFYHCNPIMNLLNSREKKIIGKDKAKNTYVKKYHGVSILYLWEKDLKENEEMCKKLILEYISNKGELNNYHSFNYYLEDENLQIKEELIQFAY